MSQWGDDLRTVLASQEREDRLRAAGMSVNERLALGVQLSMFAARMRSAFRDQRPAS